MAENNPDIILQRIIEHEAISASATHGVKNLEAILARISAQMTADAASKRTPSIAAEPRLPWPDEAGKVRPR